ncbi:MAG: hypothetical protein KC613_19060 [Myxococcales bacterium]|nr:hypothetical protein [Myxococcales bacterium]
MDRRTFLHVGLAGVGALAVGCGPEAAVSAEPLPLGEGLLAFAHGPAGDTAAQPLDCVPVTTVVKADLTCSSVAAASVLAKVERDATMVALSQEHPAFGWAVNKGYAAPEHLVALREHGPCEVHRRSWRLGQVIEHGDEPGPPTVDGEPLTSATHG